MSHDYAYIASIFKSYYITDSTLIRASIESTKPLKQVLALAKKNILEIMDLTEYGLDTVLEIDFFVVLTKLICLPV